MNAERQVRCDFITSAVLTRCSTCALEHAERALRLDACVEGETAVAVSRNSLPRLKTYGSLRDSTLGRAKTNRAQNPARSEANARAASHQCRRNSISPVLRVADSSKCSNTLGRQAMWL